MMRVVSFHTSALSRQTAEAVRIGRRGGEGAVLNSRSEYNRSFIPRLKLMEEDELKEMERMEEELAKEVGEELENKDTQWERTKAASRIAKGRATTTKYGKRGNPAAPEPRRAKRRKYTLLSGWGEGVGGVLKTTNFEWKTTDEDMRSKVKDDESGRHKVLIEKVGGDPDTQVSLVDDMESGLSPDDQLEERIVLNPEPPARRTGLMAYFGPSITTSRAGLAQGSQKMGNNSFEMDSADDEWLFGIPEGAGTDEEVMDRDDQMEDQDAPCDILGYPRSSLTMKQVLPSGDENGKVEMGEDDIRGGGVMMTRSDGMVEHVDVGGDVHDKVRGQDGVREEGGGQAQVETDDMTLLRGGVLSRAMMRILPW